ncbi:hypothetical protein COHA_010793, partial [Chlorella ohadii]
MPPCLQALQSDAQNCGACGTACEDGLSCCSGTCKDLQSDASNCGTCGTVCPEGQQCVDGECTLIQVCLRDNCAEYDTSKPECPCAKCNEGYKNVDGNCELCSNIPADVYFLADNTGSMGGIIGAVQSGATTILNDLAASSELGDLRVGVGAYRDRGDDFVFSHRVGLTADTAAAAAAINTWSAAGGYDEPEGQLYALYKASRLLGCMDEV